MKLILASNNKGKVVEFREILAGTGIEVIPQREAGIDGMLYPWELGESEARAGSARLTHSITMASSDKIRLFITAPPTEIAR